MQEKEKIKNMMREGKISKNQAELLLGALEESNAKREKLFREITSKRKSREKKMWKVMAITAIIVFFLTGSFIYLQKNQHVGRETRDALDYFNQVHAYIEEGDYQQAVRLCKKGLEKAPRFSLGYTLLGTLYRLRYEETNDISFKEKEKVSFRKAAQLQEDVKRRWTMSAVAILFLFIFIILILAALSVIALLLYNRLIRGEEKVNEAWAQIKNYQQRKLDLIPALLEVVRDYAQHEQKTLENVIQARTKAVATLDNTTLESLSKGQEIKKVLESQIQIRDCLGRLFALGEKYPDLKADAHFLTIQGQVAEAEDMVVRQRQQYNKRVRVYNSNIRYFPMNIISSLLKFQPKEYFETETKDI